MLMPQKLFFLKWKFIINIQKTNIIGIKQMKFESTCLKDYFTTKSILNRNESHSENYNQYSQLSML